MIVNGQRTGDTVNFNDSEKIKLFDNIADKYFDHNFGTMLKADLDTLIFSAYIDHCIDNDLPYDDYSVSTQLGITESRVRSLKERKLLHYPPKDYKWEDDFIRLIGNAKYNDAKKLVQLGIRDVNLMKEVRNFLYSNGWFDEYQLNPRLFQCRLDFFICMCSKLDKNPDFSEDTKKALKKLSRNEKEMTAIDRIIDGDYERGFKDLVDNVATDFLSEVLNTIPFGGMAQKAIKQLIKIIHK